ncbi:DUF4873 domain-containing protein [Gordonia iterans]
MTAVALTGASPALDRLRHALDRSPLPFEVVADPAEADLIVTGDPAPTPNHLGVAAAQVPDTFFCTTDTVDYLVAALTEAHLAGAHGVRVRPPVQDHADQPVLGFRSHVRRALSRLADRQHRFDPNHYDWITEESVEAEVFDGDVVVTVGDEEIDARLRARGHVDGNDGHFHWAGMLYSDRAAALKGDGKSRARVRIGDAEPVSAKLAELTQWGTVRMTGVGAPPWAASENLPSV